MSEGNLKEVALNKPLTSQQQTLQAGDVYKLIEKYGDELAIMNCFCRQYKNINDLDPCENGLPLETCMSFGAISTQMVENGGARRITKEEAIMEEAVIRLEQDDTLTGTSQMYVKTFRGE